MIKEAVVLGLSGGLVGLLAQVARVASQKLTVGAAPAYFPCWPGRELVVYL